DYSQSFSSISANRNSEALTRLQLVPAQQVGGTVQWTRFGDRIQVAGGLDLRDTRGTTREIAIASGNPTARILAGGKTTTIAPFITANLKLAPRWRLALGARGDIWQEREGFTQTTPLAAGITARTAFPDRTESFANPFVGIVFQPATNW